ncbi:MAG: tetratricopeptide repeat protein [Rhodospirillum sp.]|nr:tetratricopeptide repeat protein [Rhodospirillum sp.]MCF8487952.1 tetratricopeptide repeat protein [Rhodospirillum sp.]MCF8499299.1 tetratricopeptide repeat protein [Rhodospirillum sp.]
MVYQRTHDIPPRSRAREDSVRAALTRMGALPDEEIDLAEAALLLSALDNPGTDLSVLRALLLDLREQLALRVVDLGEDPDIGKRAEALRAVLVESADFHGDMETYDDLDNSDFIRVLERRMGLPIAMGILYIHLARSQGWGMSGLDFPGHFLTRLEVEGERMILDPFHDGQNMPAPALRLLLKAIMGPAAELERGHYQPVSNRVMLTRLRNNAKIRLLEKGDAQGALARVESLRLVCPGDPTLWREKGLIHLRLGDLPEAVAALDHFLEIAPQGPDRQRVDLVVKELRQRLR